MKRSRPKGPLMAVAGLVLALSPPSGAAVIEEIAASVNGTIITRSMLLEREESMVAQLSSRLVGDELDRALEQMRATLLTDMIREEILLQRAEILGLELDKVYEQALSQLKQQQGIKTNEELDEILRKEGISREELRDTLLRFNVPDIMINLEVRDKIAVSDEEVERYFRKHRSEFSSPEQFTIREIVITREKHSEEELERLAAEVKAEIDQGVPYNEIVVKYSESPSRFKDGLIGPLNRGDLIGELEEVCLALEVGQVSDPIATPAGIHFVKLESHTPAREPDLEEARADIISRIKSEKFIEALRDYFDTLMEENRVTVNPLYSKYNQSS